MAGGGGALGGPPAGGVAGVVGGVAAAGWIATGGAVVGLGLETLVAMGRAADDPTPAGKRGSETGKRVAGAIGVIAGMARWGG
jgi:hypothetical protein